MRRHKMPTPLLPLLLMLLAAAAAAVPAAAAPSVEIRLVFEGEMFMLLVCFSL
jgi:hypothetical protein